MRYLNLATAAAGVGNGFLCLARMIDMHDFTPTDIFLVSRQTRRLNIYKHFFFDIRLALATEQKATLLPCSQAD